MTQISLEMLESDPRVFDIAHAMVERRTPVLGVAHDMFDTTLARVDLPLTSRVAIGLGIRTFEVVAGEELAANVSSGELVRYATQGERTGNFIIQMLEDLYAAGRQLPDKAPDLAEASERIVVAHLDVTSPALIMLARSGAGIMHEVFSETYLSAVLDIEG